MQSLLTMRRGNQWGGAGRHIGLKAGLLLESTQRTERIKVTMKATDW